MTEPVARVPYPRRTVRVATALVAGQAALCAIIGWVTLGSSHPRPADPDRPGGPPVVRAVVPPTTRIALPPPVAVPSTSAPRTRPRTWTRAPRPPELPEPRRLREPPARATTAEPSATTMLTPAPLIEATSSSPAPPASPTPGATVLPSPQVQRPVVEGEPCDPPGALGLTVDNIELHCVAGDGGPRWRVV